MQKYLLDESVSRQTIGCPVLAADSAQAGSLNFAGSWEENSFKRSITFFLHTEPG